MKTYPFKLQCTVTLQIIWLLHYFLQFCRIFHTVFRFYVKYHTVFGFCENFERFYGFWEKYSSKRSLSKSLFHTKILSKSFHKLYTFRTTKHFNNKLPECLKRSQNYRHWTVLPLISRCTAMNSHDYGIQGLGKYSLSELTSKHFPARPPSKTAWNPETTP